jgi:DNA polymerase (family 10)
MPDKKLQIISLLQEIAQRLQLQGGNRFRARAYRTAADSLSAVTKPLGEIIKAGELTAIPGIGSAIAAVIERLYKDGTDPALKKLRRDIPSGVLQMQAIPGMRSNQILKIYKETGISSVEALQKAIESGELRGKKGFTLAFEQKFLQGLKIHQEAGHKKHIHRATALLESAKKNLDKTHHDLRNIIIAGDLRRQCELVEDLSLVAISDKPESIKPLSGDITLHLCREKNFGSSLLFATGSAPHLQSLIALATKKHMTLTADGLKKGRKIIASKTEEEIYKALGLAFIPPELREGQNEIEKAEKNQIPKLVDLENIRGILHAHTVRSDGANTLEEMAEATKQRGFSYLGITDHSQSAYYAGGMKADEVLEQMKEADRLNKKYAKSFHIFKGIESDILAQGELDYPNSILKRFDFIIASIHSRFKMDRQAQTERILRAIKNPYTTILGHMTGRQLLRRPGYEIDIEAILKACAKHRVAVEVNAHPWRLDFDWRWHQMALEFGCIVSINPDAHSTREIDNVKWGVAMARKGGISPEHVLNCMSAEQFGNFIKQKRQKNEKKQSSAPRRSSPAWREDHAPQPHRL